MKNRQNAVRILDRRTKGANPGRDRGEVVKKATRQIRATLFHLKSYSQIEVQFFRSLAPE